MKPTPRLKRHLPGKWIVDFGTCGRKVYAVSVGRRVNVWELQYEDGSLAFGDGFEGLAGVRAYLKDQYLDQTKNKFIHLLRGTEVRATLESS